MPTTAGAPGRKRNGNRRPVRISATFDRELLDRVDADADRLGASRALMIARAVECGVGDAEVLIEREGEE